jgi:hypothetical protein
MAAAVVAAFSFFAAQTAIVDEAPILAARFDLDVTELRGAANTMHTTPRGYLEGEGLLPRPAPPIPAGLLARVKCIEAKESGGANIWNRAGSGAGGVMQFMPSTFARSAREMGHPEWSLWNPQHARVVAAHDLALGRRAQWTVSGC